MATKLRDQSAEMNRRARPLPLGCSKEQIPTRVGTNQTWRKQKSVITTLAFAVFILLPFIAKGVPESSKTVEMTDLVVIKAGGLTAPPPWAVIQRLLIKTMEEAAPVYLKRFTRAGGTVYGEGMVDDVYEMFFNWPLFFAMGGDEKLLHWALQEWSAITRQFTYQDAQVHKEFFANSDWFHISEGSMAFYDFGVADPTIPENVMRSRRFAGLYLNEDKDASNYDSKHRIIRSPFNGSQGPRFTAEVQDVKYRLDPQYGWSTLFPVVKDLEPNWSDTDPRRKQIQELFEKMVMSSDIPVNLPVTGLLTNAYLYTGEEKYKQWVLDYVEAWMERIRQNRGIIPDNIGSTGTIGENRQGQWWGGFFGWTSRYSVYMIYGALSVAAECAQLVSGDSRYLDLLRSQIDMLMKESVARDGQLLVPYKYGPKGWEDYRPMMIRDLAHLWHASMDAKDWDRIEKVRAGSKTGPPPYTDALLANPRPEIWKPDGIKSDWNRVESVGDRDDDNRTEFPRLQYYAGRNPDWPERILRADYEEVCRRMEFMRNDRRDIYSIVGDDLYPNNPVITKGLQQVTLGAPQTIYNGGLLRARVRYFDRDRRRPGLPPDVAALVEKLEADRTVLQLVNLSATESRNLIVQAGAFGEHSFTEVKYLDPQEGANQNAPVEKRIPVNKKYFAVQLPPASGINLDVGTRRFVNRPSYAFPWHGDKVPLR